MLKLNVDKFPFNIIAIYRFSKAGRIIELNLVHILSRIYFGGDRVTWEKKRLEAYKKWEKGYTAAKLAFEYHLPIFIVNTWVVMWEPYRLAFGGYK